MNKGQFYLAAVVALISGSILNGFKCPIGLWIMLITASIMIGYVLAAEFKK